MKPQRILTFTLILTSLLMLSSCKKEKTGTLEYQITPMNNSITKITYADANGNAVVVTDLSQFANGIKDVTVSQSQLPLNAYLTVDVNNTTSSVLTFFISINAQGAIKRQEVNVPIMSTATRTVTYTIPKP